MDPIAGFSPSHPLYIELSQGYAIRLIELLPGHLSSTISIRLSIHELDQTPDYEAISYVWGDPNDTTTVLCNGKELHVTLNLVSALRRVRYLDRSRILWADAVCINQGNNREKSHHVAFMSRVYRQATTVLIFLGDAPDDEAEDIVALLTDHEQRRLGHNSVNDMPYVADADPVFKDHRWNSLASLKGKSWFSRAWVLQEAGVARRPLALYGNVEFEYRALVHLLRWILNRAAQLEKLYRIPLWTIHTDWEDWSPNWRNSQAADYGILDFLSQARSLQCHDHRDHVYAFLGHPLLQRQDGSGPIIQPDYALPLRRVFWQLGTQLLTRFGLSVLSAVEHNEQSINDHNVPSWVVRWDIEMTKNSLGYPAGYYFRAGDFESLDTAHLLSFDEAKRELLVQTVLVDEVDKLYQFPISEDDWVDGASSNRFQIADPLNKILSRIWEAITDTSNPCIYADQPTAIEALSLCFCAGLADYECIEANSEVLARHRDHFHAFWSSCQTMVASDLTEAEEVSSESVDNNTKANRYYYDCNLSSEGRCFFINKKGYYGIGPWVMQPGDECHVVMGARVPFILRKEPGDSPELKFVGEAYLHGIMHGQIAKEQGSDKWKHTVLS